VILYTVNVQHRDRFGHLYHAGYYAFARCEELALSRVMKSLLQLNHAPEPGTDIDVVSSDR
jgi:acyl-CoA thioesterase FadM